jgi:transposase
MFSREFKLETVRQIASGAKRPSEVCREYGLAQSVLSRWRQAYASRGEKAFSTEENAVHATQEQRLAELERFCGRLAFENDQLKKALQGITP